MYEHVLSGLLDRRATVAGELEATRARLDQLHADLATLDAMIRQFDPAYPVDDIQMKRVRSPVLGMVTNTSRSVLDMLRTLGSLTIPAMVERVMVERALDPTNSTVRAAVVSSVGRTVRHQRQAGHDGRSRIWEIGS